ncbi:MAG: STAS domain-containing protein [Solirubrobacterales bacterium]
MSGGQLTRNLTINAGHEDADYRIRLIGEFDLDSRDRVENAISYGEASGADRVIVDVSGLEFIDSTGLGVLLAAKKRADISGQRLRFTRGTGHVAEFFRLTAMDLTLPFVERTP